MMWMRGGGIGGKDCANMCVSRIGPHSCGAVLLQGSQGVSGAVGVDWDL
jgi:hypothetical protein